MSSGDVYDRELYYEEILLRRKNIWHPRCWDETNFACKTSETGFKYFIVKIQLFRERLFNKSIKAYATMPKGIMGCGRSLCHRQVHEFFSAMEGGTMNIYLRVLKETNKGRYDTYSVKGVPLCENANTLRTAQGKSHPGQTQHSKLGTTPTERKRTPYHRRSSLLRRYP